jgi:hypothetical protein
MTFGQLVEEVVENISGTQGGPLVQTGEVRRLLNLAMREISLRTGLPTAYITVPGDGSMQSGAFSLPSWVHPEGVKYAEVIEVQSGANTLIEGMENRQIAILSVAEANEFHPRWEDDDYQGPPFLLYSHFSRNDGVRPIGITSARYRLLVHVNPVPMVDNDDLPFALPVECQDESGNPVQPPTGGPAYHRVLALHVSYELLQRLNSDAWQMMYARYRAMEEELFSSAQQAVVRLPQWRGSRQVRRYA